MRNALIVIILAATLLIAAPTTIRIAMLAGPTLANGGVLVLAPTGQVQVATLGAGVSLISDGKGSYTLQAIVPKLMLGVKPARQQDGSYLLPDAATAAMLVVFRNGVRQSAGDDYTYDSTTKRITPVAAVSWNDDDLVLCDYVY
jgi:hypothetical protein